MLPSSGKSYADVLVALKSIPDRGYTFLQGDGTERTISFAQLAIEAERRGRQLLARGLKRGDALALIIPEGDEFVQSFLACIYTGIVPVPLYPPVAFGKLDAYIASTAQLVSASKAKLLLTTAKAQHVLWSLVDRVPGLGKLLTVEELQGNPTGPLAEPEKLQPEDIAFLQFTSGSTSTPKGVMVTHASILANTRGIMEHTLESNRDDKGVSWLPLYHDMGLIGFVLAPLRYLVPVYFIPTLSFVRRPTLWLETVHKFRGTITFAPNFAFSLATRRTSPEQVKALDLSCLKVVGCGAEPNHGETLRAFVTHFLEAGLKPESILPSYGMAEATLAMSFNPLRETFRADWILADPYHQTGHAIPAGLEDEGTAGSSASPPQALEGPDSSSGETVLEFVTCGFPLPGHHMRVVDEQGNPLPDRQVGEVVFAGPSVTAGYFQNAEATQASFQADGLHTGDLGYMVQGELFVTGRKKDLIILNGRNYDPQSIEWSVSELPGLRKGNVVAFSRPGSVSEELVLVAESKTPAEEQDTLRQTVATHVREQFGLVVAEVVLLEPGSLPKTTSGKLQRNKTRQQYLAGQLGQEGSRTMGAQGQTLVVARHVARSLVSRFKHEVLSRVKS